MLEICLEHRSNYERIVMILKLKVLGLACVAVLAMSAVVSPAAQATPEFTCSAYPCSATGSNTAGSETFTTPGGTIQCESHVIWEKYRTLFGEAADGPISTRTITHKYFGCTAFGFLGATVSMNDCDTEWHATEKLGEGHYNGHIVTNCPQGKRIVITAGTCEVTVDGQSLTTVTTQNNANGTVTVVPNVTNITMNVVKDGFGCPFSGTGHVKGSYHGHVVIARVGGGTISVSGE